MSSRRPMAPVAGLSTVPAPPRRPAEQDQPTPATPSPTPPKRAPRPRTGAAEPRPAGRTTRKSAPATPAMRAISVSVPAALVPAWRERARRDGISQPDVVLDAISGQREALPRLVRDLQTRRDAAGAFSDGLFVRRREQARQADLHVPVSLRMRAENVDALDRLCVEAGARSRSLLVSAALEAWLGG